LSKGYILKCEPASKPKKLQIESEKHQDSVAS